MKKMLTTLVLLLLLTVPGQIVQAQPASVTYEGGAEKYVFFPGSDFSDSDLFPEFKNAMPGDVIHQDIAIRNNYKGSKSVRIFLRAEAHSGTANPISEPTASSETLPTMQDFLSQLTMTVWQGDQPIYHGSPDQTRELTRNVLLGVFTPGQTSNLRVELEVPTELDNRYASRIGEVDWIFLAEEIGSFSPVQVTLTAEKFLDGKAPVGNKFNFLLKDSANSVLQRKPNRGGQILFDTLLIDSPGTHVYYVSEETGKDQTITYDPTVYEVQITVQGLTDEVDVRIVNQTTNIPSELVFRNVTNGTSPEGPKDPDPENPGPPDKPTPPNPTDPANPTDPGNPPKTGDESAPLLWGMVFLLGVAGMIYVIYDDRRKAAGKRNKVKASQQPD